MEKKYIPLAQFFQSSSEQEIILTYAEMETIIGQQLPNTAYLNASWWKKKKHPLTHYEAWTGANYFIKSVVLGSMVVFTKEQTHSFSNTSKREIITVREMELIDCKAFLNLKRTIFEEALYDSFNREQYTTSIQAIRQNLSDIKKNKNGMILIALYNTKIVGYIEITKCSKHCNLHVADIHFGVLSDYSNKGIGHQLIKAAKSWCLQHNLTRLEATVCEKNDNAKQLLNAEQFIQEGIRYNSYITPRQTLNEIYFGAQL